jgi:hypothetical protein
MAQRLSIFVCHDQAPVPMGLVPWLASAKFTLLAWRGTAGGTTDSEYLLGNRFFMPDQIMPRIRL